MMILDNNYQIELYKKSLSKAMLRVSENQLDEKIAEEVAYQYAKQIDYSNSMLMHVSIATVAINLVAKIKSEHFKL